MADVVANPTAQTRAAHNDKTIVLRNHLKERKKRSRCGEEVGDEDEDEKDGGGEGHGTLQER